VESDSTGAKWIVYIGKSVYRLFLIIIDKINVSKALSYDTRLRMLNLFLEKKRCVFEIVPSLDISQTRAFRNLSALYHAGFLKVRKDGLWPF
jgi:ArsR family transcriptional regulator